LSRKIPIRLEQDPRETVTERLIERFGLNEHSDIRSIAGENLDLSEFE